MEIRNYGKVRGINQIVARLHMSISVASLAEAEVLAERISALTGIPMATGLGDGPDTIHSALGAPCSRVQIAVSSRRAFATIPAVIRLALAAGLLVSVSQWDEGLLRECSLAEQPAQFWQTIALAGLFYKE